MVLLLLANAPGVLGQGSVIFHNRVTGAGGVVAPIYGPNPNCFYMRLSGNATTNGGTIDYTGHPLLFGTTFSAQLLGGDPGNLLPLSTVQFRTTASFAGFITPPAIGVFIAGRPGGTFTWFQVRAWDNGGNILSTYADALASGTRAVGQSDVFGPIELGTPPATPPNLVGLTSFNLTLAAGPCVPEPSVVVLGALAGVALLRRRKKVSP